MYIYIYIYILWRKREQDSMRLGHVGTEGLWICSRSEDPTKIPPKPSKKQKILPKPPQNPRRILPRFTLGALLGPPGPLLGHLGLESFLRKRKT